MTSHLQTRSGIRRRTNAYQTTQDMDPSDERNVAPSIPPPSLTLQTRSAMIPPPLQAVLSSPQQFQADKSLGMSSAGNKRRMVIDDGSDIFRHHFHVPSPSELTNRTISDFTNNTKAQVRALHNNRCWHCGGKPADICYIIGSKDASSLPWF